LLQSLEKAEETLSREEVIRRLRLLKEPVTLFGEARIDLLLLRTQPHK
jgi:pre-mRNA processing factor 4 (PRP4) like